MATAPTSAPTPIDRLNVVEYRVVADSRKAGATRNTEVCSPMGIAAYPTAQMTSATSAAGSQWSVASVSSSAPAINATSVDSDRRTDGVRARKAPAPKFPATPAAPITSSTTLTRWGSTPITSTTSGVT